MKQVFKVGCLIVFCLLSVGAAADEVTHTLGTTGYMIQEAMWARANKYDRETYFKAVKLQYEAKRYLRGTHKKGRSVSLAVALSKRAYELAKKARDKALAVQRLPVSF